MMSKRPKLIHCPNCKANRVNRLKKSCYVCGVSLIFVDEWFFPDDPGYIWGGNRWGKISDLRLPP